MYLDIGQIKSGQNNGRIEYHNISCCSITDYINHKACGWLKTIQKCFHQLSYPTYSDIRAWRSAETQNWKYLVHCVGYLVI